MAVEVTVAGKEKQKHAKFSSEMLLDASGCAVASFTEETHKWQWPPVELALFSGAKSISDVQPPPIPTPTLLRVARGF